MYVPRAMYSLRMSFWTAPASLSAATPCFSAIAMDRASRMGAVERDAREELFHVLEARDGHADLADVALCHRVVGVVAHLRRQVEGDREARLPLLEEVAVAAVGLGRRAEARVLAHGPEPAAVHRGLHAARVRELARETHVAEVVLVRDVLGSVDALERRAVGSREEPRPVGRLVERGPERPRFPLSLRVLELLLLFGRHRGHAFIGATPS